MHRVLFAALVCVAIGQATSSLRASVLPFRQLTIDQRVALQLSEVRLGRFDHTLQALERARAHRTVSQDQYRYEQRDLLAYIGAESQFQNDILINHQPFPPEETREVLETIAKYSILVPAYIASLAAKGLAGHSFSIIP